MSSLLEEKLRDLPHSPGVYIFKSISGAVIYVGKAKNLKNRVSSYFQQNLPLGTKTQALVSRIVDLELIKTESELEALILEAELIKKYYPKYNVIQKDDKSYLFIVIRDEVVTVGGKHTKLAKVITARETDLLKGDITFGPYPSGNDAKSILKSIRKIFPFRDCSQVKFARYEKMNKPCLFGHLGLCRAPCLADSDIRDYRLEISRIKRFLSGGTSTLINQYEKLMDSSARNLNYEEAAKYRDYLNKLKYVRENYKSATEYMDNPNLVEDIAQESLTTLMNSLVVLEKIPLRIECYDISNISGKEAVGSMVVATNGQIDKKEYKRFKIKLLQKPDDFSMMKEVLERRLKRSLPGYKGKESWPVPDLLVLDGGKGQVSVVSELLGNLGLNIPLIGLAKREETVVYLTRGEFAEVLLPLDNSGLKLLIRLRDEAHRFAQSYHHYLRLKKLRA